MNMMKTRIAIKEDLSILKELWYECFLDHDSKESIDYYFESSFDLDHTFILEDDNELLCSLQLNQHQISYQNKVESVSFVVGVATPLKHRRKGYMKILLNDAIKYAKEELKQNYMILQAYDWNVYRPFGFFEAYYKNEVTYSIEDLNNITIIQEKEVSAHSLLAIYQNYTKNLDGYKIRDLEYFDKLLKIYQVEKINILVTEEAYLSYYEDDEYIEVSECAYHSQEALEKALKLLVDKYQKPIKVMVDNLFEKENSKQLIYMMVKNLNREFIISDKLFISEEI